MTKEERQKLTELALAAERAICSEVWEPQTYTRPEVLDYVVSTQPRVVLALLDELRRCEEVLALSRRQHEEALALARQHYEELVSTFANERAPEENLS